MSIISAELTKISVNSYITMKISFTNQLRMIAEQFPKANIHTSSKPSAATAASARSTCVPA
jgi:UDP-glucose 6-dehydrogenase